MNETVKSEILALRKNSKIAYVASVNDEGYPQIKAMMVLENDNTRVHWFSTNTSSKRVRQFQNNPKASVYYCDNGQFKAVLFTGTIEIFTDHDTKAFLWRDGCEIYYPKGVDDEDYCVYKFTAKTVNYYHGLSNITFLIDELV